MATLDGIVVTGELILLNPQERVQFYVQTCKAMGLDPLVRPLQYFEQIDHGRPVLILYALRAASSQLSRVHKLSVSVTQNPDAGPDMAIFKARVTDPEGRSDEAIGAMCLTGLKGKALADAIMTAQTKAKRRAILDYAGYALLDESEIEGMNGRPYDVTEEAIKGFVAAPAAPQANAAPATEVDVKVVADLTKTPVLVLQPSAEPAVVLPPPQMQPAPSVVPPGNFNSAPTAAETKQAEKLLDEIEVKREMDKVFARLSTYRRDVLQRGGMKPSKGFGIQAKWEKFLRKHAPDKTLEQYQTLLIALDLCLQQIGEAGVVQKVEQEIV